MTDGIAYQNKDILFKILSQNYPHVSFRVYGLDLPPVKAVLPTDLPDIEARELRADGVFLLEDESLLIVDYESTAGADKLFKYGYYAFRVADRYKHTEGKLPRITVAVIYTGDVASAPSSLDLGCLRMNIRQVFLKDLDGDGIVAEVGAKIEAKEALSDDDMLRLIVAPLAGTEVSRQALLERCVDIAKEIGDRHLQIFTVAALLVASDKFVDRDYSEMVRGWLNLTKVGQIIFEEIEAAAAAAAATAAAAASVKAAKEKENIAENMLRDGMEPAMVIKYTGLSGENVEAIMRTLPETGASGVTLHS
jgi:hypothetical protein